MNSTLVRNRFPTGLLGMAILVIAIESLVQSRLDVVSDWMSFTWRFASTAAAGPASKAEVLFLGDSLMKGGVLPPLIESELGIKSYNHSIHGGTAPSTYILLQRLVDSGARPKVVVVDFHPNLLAVAPRSNEYWADLLTSREMIELAWRAGDPMLLAKTWLNQGFPSYRHRVQIQAGLLASFRQTIGFAELYNTALKRNYERNAGARLLPVAEQMVRLDPNFKINPNAPPWKPHPANVAYLRKLFRLADAKGIAIIWLLPPTSPEWAARRRAMNAEGPHEAFVKQMQGEFPNLRVADGRESGYPNAAFKDLTHLHAGGATELSLGLASILKPFLNAERNAIPRWITLPGYQGRRFDPTFEVVDEVKIAHEAGAGTLRR